MKGADVEQAKAAGPGRPGLYVHVPFCASTCDFCAFYQVKPTTESMESFLTGIAAEAALVPEADSFGTIFWGGGTPGLLAPAALARLAAIVGSRGSPPSEWTVELAPASVTPERLAVLREAGVTRLSLGIQSFQPVWLEALGRQHSVEQVRRAYDRIRAGGWSNVNVDLMFAFPGQSEADWQADLTEAIALAPEHISTYCLTFEEDTALWAKLSQGKVKLDPEKELAFYEAGWARLAEAGYDQYEVSNFARPGYACRHNLATWAMQDWVGLGPSAASQGGGWRGANIADLGVWRERIAAGQRMTEARVQLSPSLLAEDALIFGLRMNAGVDLAPWQVRCPEAPWAEFETTLGRLEEDGLLGREGSRVRLTHRGRLMADAVGAELISVPAASSGA
jgi:oxygen-independent coproporphyrinogen-3 oxidase